MSFGGFLRRKTYWLIDFLKGSPVRSHYNDIKFILSNSEKGNSCIQMHLEKLLSHATTNTVFYNKYKGNALSQFPVMNKLSFIENYDKIFVKKIWDEKNDYISTTSGSTGIQLKVYQDKRKRNRVIAELKYFGERSGYKSHEHMIQMRVWGKKKKTKWEEYIQNIISIDVDNLNNQNLLSIYNLLIKRNIKAILSYPNSIDLLAKYIIDNKLQEKNFKVKTIITGGEVLDINTRKNLENIFCCKVVSRYSNQENGVLGQQEPNDDDYFSLNHASYFFEILKLDSDEKAAFGELGRIIITDLFNYAFPIIRYDTGDTGIMINGVEIKQNRPVLNEIYGRRRDNIYNSEGSPVNPHFIAISLMDVNGLKQWQFIQKSKNQYTIKVNANPNIKLDNAVKLIKDILGYNAIINIEFVNEIPVLQSGKRKSVINEYRND